MKETGKATPSICQQEDKLAVKPGRVVKQPVEI